ncbi:MAG TPA: hypothetical protein VMT89_17170 [Candidatus Acidoferrales bacterium]|nr:hypothetical protein [Candidatus Acidoferrales bacterium]
MNRWVTIGFVSYSVIRVASIAGATPRGSVDSHQALALCHQADNAIGLERSDTLKRGLQLAERARETDDRDAAAHFAIFCNLGKQIRFAGLSWSSLRHVRRLRHEIDRTLELAPDDPDALTAKGELLLELPGILGGDTDEGTRLLQRAIAVDPSNEATRLFLTRTAR